MSSTVQYGFWAISVLLQVGIVAGMVMRKMYREYPAFFGYTILHIARTAALFGVLRLYEDKKAGYATYFWMYWGSDLVTTLLVAFVISCLFHKLFRDYDALRRYGSIAFGGCVALMLLVAIVVTALSPGNEAHPLISAILLFQRSFMVIQIGLVLLLSAFAGFAAMPWREEFSFGIALGFGLDAAIELAAVAMRTQFGIIGNEVYGFMRVAAYTIALLLWFLYILAPPNKTAIAEHPAASNVQDWNQALTELLSR